jgi:hypothetical protein
MLIYDSKFLGAVLQLYTTSLFNAILDLQQSLIYLIRNAQKFSTHHHSLNSVLSYTIAIINPQIKLKLKYTSN